MKSEYHSTLWIGSSVAGQRDSRRCWRLATSGRSFARQQLRRPAPSPQVRRLVDGFLKPPTTERALVSLGRRSNPPAARSTLRFRVAPHARAWGQAEPPAFYVLAGRGDVDKIRLPQHLVGRIEASLDGQVLRRYRHLAAKSEPFRSREPRRYSASSEFVIEMGCKFYIDRGSELLASDKAPASRRLRRGCEPRLHSTLPLMLAKRRRPFGYNLSSDRRRAISAASWSCVYGLASRSMSITFTPSSSANRVASRMGS